MCAMDDVGGPWSVSGFKLDKFHSPYMVCHACACEEAPTSVVIHGLRCPSTLPLACPQMKELLHKGLQSLHYAAAQGRGETHEAPNYPMLRSSQLAEILIKAGARAGGVDNLGYTPLHLAAYHGNMKVRTRVLLKPHFT